MMGEMVVGFGPQITSYETTDSTNFTYITNNGTISITGYTGSSSVVVIPSSINGLPVTGLAVAVFFSYSSLTYVSIPNGITSVPPFAFYNCGNLTGVQLPNDVSSIGNDAFAYCGKLVSLTFPNTLTSIGDR